MKMYFHATLLKAEKKLYRTKEGVFNQISNRKKWLDEKNRNSNQQIDTTIKTNKDMKNVKK